MNGPEHYLTAERLADQANHYIYGDGSDPVTGAALAAEAQVHATLALAAATALATTGDMPIPDCDSWTRVAGVHRDEPTGPGRSAPAPEEDETPWADRIGQRVTVTYDDAGLHNITGHLAEMTSSQLTVVVGTAVFPVDLEQVTSVVPAPPAADAASGPAGWPPRIGDVWEIDREQYWACGRPSEPRLLTPTGKSWDAEGLRQSATSVKLLLPGRERTVGGVST
ncbi:hypothetical protein ACRYCC_25985 [Actinomadura scrupuli]|uniref:hypothetical protein n=1 Tax=Actinomadura scrupuli TaxID=559629 RepID=UPI003D959262